MDQDHNQYEMPIPDYAEGTHILLIDPDVTSLIHTSSVLQEATYRVTCTELPEIALSMMQERVNEFDIVIAAVEMRGMDFLTFISRAKILSNTPVVLMSYKKDEKLAARVLPLGVCHLYVKPISKYDIRSLWQYKMRKNRTADPGPVGITVDSARVLKANPKWKGKEVMVETEARQESSGFPTRELTIRENGGAMTKENEIDIRKQKRSDDGNKVRGKETEKSAGQPSGKPNGDLRTEKGTNKKENGKGKVAKKRVQWNAELYAKFMKILRTESGEAQQPEQNASGPSHVLKSAQASGHQQVYQGAEGSQSGNGVANTIQIQGASSHSGQTSFPEFKTACIGGQSFCPSSQLLSTSCWKVGKQNSQTGFTSGTSSMSRTPLSHNAHNQFAVQDPADENINDSGLGYEVPNLKGRIDQIRQAYRASSASGKTSSPSNTQDQGTGGSNEEEYQAGNTMNYEILESMPSSGKRSRSQFEYPAGSGYTSIASDMEAGQVKKHAGITVQPYGHNGLNTSSTTLGFSHLQNMWPPSKTTSAPLFMSSANFAPSLVQNAFDRQLEPSGLFQAPNCPSFSTNNNTLFCLEEIPTGRTVADHVMVSEAGLPNQNGSWTNGFDEKTFKGYADIYASEGFMTNAGARSLNQAVYDDNVFVDDFLAEMRTDIGDDDLRSLGIM